MRQIIALLLSALPATVVAAPSCQLPPDLTPAPVVRQEVQRVLPVEKLVLAYYWWPENCVGDRSDADAAGCRAGFGFRVHGLWPDGAGRTYPQFCRVPTQLDVATVRANWCMTPSTSLLQHEWAKHGTCHWATPRDYFRAARRVADTITMPDATALPANRRTAGGLRDAIVAANPKLPRTSLFVGTARKQWLTEVRVCLDLRYQPVACDGDSRGAPDAVPI